MVTFYTSKTLPLYGPTFFSNWGDLFMPAIANKMLPMISSISWIKPNHLTLLSFFLYTLGCLAIVASLPFHLFLVAILLPISYIFDCLDGQLSRAKNLSSPLGDYLDKTLDVLKIYIVTFCLSLATYQKTGNVIYILLGFTACFFFNFRYYIKHEVIYSEMSRDIHFLEKAADRRNKMNSQHVAFYTKLSQSFSGEIRKLWYKHRSILWVDEAEFVIFTAIAALFDQFELALIIFAFSQVTISCFRFFERGYKIAKAPYLLLDPLRK